MVRAIPTTKAMAGRTMAAALAALSVAALGVFLAPASASAEGAAPSAAAAFEWATNVERAAHGLAPLSVDLTVSVGAQEWSGGMALFNTLIEDVHYSAELSATDPRWRSNGENVGWGYSPQQIQSLFMASPAHRANILGSYTHMGIGVFVDGAGRYWVTERFYS